MESAENPDERWAGVQRALTTTDFEAANIEYIQFWVMDPFNEDSENETGVESCTSTLATSVKMS